jgi:hypothetical protein
LQAEGYGGVHNSYPVRGLSERAARYRQLAARAEEAAGQSETEGLRAGWRKIAQDWTDLALSIERQLHHAEPHPMYQTRSFTDRRDESRSASRA